jgi:hypothetical protein
MALGASRSSDGTTKSAFSSLPSRLTPMLLIPAARAASMPRIYHNDAPFGRNAQFGCSDEEHLWIRFAAMNVFGRDRLLENVGEAQGLEDGLDIGTPSRRCDCRPPA